MNTELQALLERRSIRSYKPDMVPQELIDQVIEAGLYAASGHGEQDSIIVAVTNKEVRDKLSQMNRAIMGTKSDTFYGAPVVLIVLAPKSNKNAIYDASLISPRGKHAPLGHAYPMKNGCSSRPNLTHNRVTRLVIA